MPFLRPLSSRSVQVGALLGILTLLVVFVSLRSRAQAEPPNCPPVSTPAPATLFGTDCDDIIVSAPGIEKIEAGAGDDTIYASAVDLPVEVPGIVVNGGPGADVIYGHLPTASDEPTGGSSTATISLESCPQACFKGLDNDVFNGDTGPDIVFGERGNDELHGGGGNDLLYGGIGDDFVTGDAASDMVAGGFGADRVEGNAGDDLLRGDGGADTIVEVANEGTQDTLSYATGVAPGFTKSVPGGPYPNFPGSSERGVYLDLSAGDADNGVAPNAGGVDTLAGLANFENVIGTPFSDYIVGSAGPNKLDGGGGGDVILGRAGDDKLYGGPGGDHLDGETAVTANTLDGGAGSASDSDYCTQGNAVDCERSGANTGITARNTAAIGFGFMAADDTSGSFASSNFVQLYVTGMSAGDNLSATYISSPAGVRFTASAGSFDSAQAGTSGCAYGATVITCTIPSGKRLDSVVIAGMEGGDFVNLGGDVTNIPAISSATVLGGTEADWLIGSSSGEEVLADGSDANLNTEFLQAYGRDDALLNNGGNDQLYGGDGNDLLLSNTICTNDLLGGGPGQDNASWAKFGTAIEARIAEGKAGLPGGPVCNTGTPDNLDSIDDLEGTFFNDILYGGAFGNNLLGRKGNDYFNGRDGVDLLLTNSADFDATITCGAPGLPQKDVARIDVPGFGDQADGTCETVDPHAAENTGS
jgi:Ca2+-binding RTX toxin-like protein